MAEKQVVRCVQDCWDSKRNRYYVRGDQDSVDPLEPLAKYFEGWAPETEVYHKIPGTKTTPSRETTRIIPGKVVEAVKEEASGMDDTCEYCNNVFKSKAGKMAHQRFCEAALTAGVVTPLAQPED